MSEINKTTGELLALERIYEGVVACDVGEGAKLLLKGIRAEIKERKNGRNGEIAEERLAQSRNLVNGLQSRVESLEIQLADARRAINGK